MFQPSIYITNRLLQNIVTIELADAELVYKYKSFSVAKKQTFLLSIFQSFEKKHDLVQHSGKIIFDCISGKSDVESLHEIKNAYQAVDAFEQSLRAEDDWNLMLRINQLLNKESLSIQNTNIRGKEEIEEDAPLTIHTFANSQQTEHSVLELLRWYRKSETELNKYIRFLTLIYHLLRIYPFKSKNFSTIMLCAIFWTKESSLYQINLIPFATVLSKNTQKDMDINDFIKEYTKKIISETRKNLFEFEKKSLQLNAPKKILNLNKRQIELIKILHTKEKITRSEAAEFLDVSFMTAYRDIKGLVKKRLLVEGGIGRATYYVLSSK